MEHRIEAKVGDGGKFVKRAAVGVPARGVASGETNLAAVVGLRV